MEVTESLEAEVIRLEEIIRLHEVLQQRQFAALESMIEQFGGVVIRERGVIAGEGLLERLCLCGITACPPSAEIHKTALGAEDTVPWTYHKDALTAVRELREAGYCVLALEQVEGSLKLGDFRPAPGVPHALVLGNEVKGVQQTVVDACTQALEIPQYGMKHSLNVSVSAGIAMWELSRWMRQ